MSPRVAIVYLSYNAKPYLKQVVDSIAALSYPKESLAFIVVDNASPDGSADLIRETVVPRSGHDLPTVVFFPSATNLGFSAGCNLGIDHALLDGLDYVYLLNNDAKLQPDAITEAVAMAESDAKIGAVQSLVRLWKMPEKINATGGMVHFLGFGFVRDNGRVMSEADVAPLDGTDIAYASGAAVLYRASVLREVGLLDPFYFLYHEDLELGWRIRLAGYRNVLAARSVAEHNYEFKRSIQKFFWMERNRWVVDLGLLRLRTILVLLPWMLTLEVALILFALKGGWIREKLLVYRDLLRPATWKHIRAKRQTIATLRRVEDRDIVRYWTSRIAHQEVSNPIVDYVANPVLTVLWFLIRPFVR